MSAQTGTSHITIDSRRYDVVGSTMSTTEMKALARLSEHALVFEKTSTGLKELRASEAIVITDGAEFFSVPQKRRLWERMDWSFIGVLFAIVTSILSFGYSIWSSAQNSGRDSTRGLYREYFEVSKAQLQAPLTMHVFALPNAYEEVAKQVSFAVKDDERAKVLLLERSMADYLFSLFEFMYLDRQHTWKMLDWDRANFDDDALTYLSQLLQNPRLLYYWDEGKLASEYHTGTTQYYDSHVRQPGQWHDLSGPLQAANASKSTVVQP